MDTKILDRIDRATLRFLRPLTLEDTYKTITEEAIKLVEGDEGYLAMADENGELKIVYAVPASLMSIEMRRRGFSHTSYSKRKAFVTYLENFTDIHPELVEIGIQSTIFIPLSNKDQSIGVMNIMSKHRSKRFSQKELSILKLFGSMASLAIRKTHLYDEIKKALEMRDLFISMAAHEFRTPLTSINGYVQLLHSKLSGGEGAESRWIEQLSSETLRLTQLVNELLEMNRIKSGKLQYIWKEQDLRDIISRALNSFRFSYPERKIVFKDYIDGALPLVIGDFDKLLQVMTNLFDNAVKFSPSESEIRVSLNFKKLNFMISIQDQGVGIPEKDLDKIFEGYYQGSNTSKEGLGIGLYLVNDIVRRHHGAVKIYSKPNKGTTVEVRLPKAKFTTNLKVEAPTP